MAGWAAFETAAPALAKHGRDLLYRTGIVDSPKARDLAEDGRYALHSHLDLQEPHEFSIRGRARPIDDPATRAAIAADWPFEPDDGYRLFEFLIEHAVAGERPTPNDWPPRYSSWRATD